MQYNFVQKPDFTAVRVLFEAPGEAMLVETSAMLAKDTAVEMKTQMTANLDAMIDGTGPGPGPG